MNNETRIIIDSDYSFAEALAGTNAPLEIIDKLSILDVCYFSFDGLKHQGQIIIDKELEDDVTDIFALIENMKFPVGKVLPICSYCWHDGDSMADNNSSAFNFRLIEGTTKLSLHSLGRAVDINPVQNPVIYPSGIVAPADAAYDPQKAGTLSAGHQVVEEFLKRGWRWGGNFEQPKDYHHFEKI
jgi:hypothetical protein